MPGKSHESLYSGKYVRAHTEAAQKAIAAMGLPPRSRILDLGCGSATRTSAMAMMGYRCVGLDISRSMLDLARKRRVLDRAGFGLVRGDQITLPFRQNAFDGATCTDYAFGYFGPEGDREVLVQISEALRSGGILFLEYINPSFVKTHWGDWAEGSFGTYCRATDTFQGGRQMLYGPDEWESMLGYAGYADILIRGSDSITDTFHPLDTYKHYLLIILARRS
jgi:SAM-dependent methyltransferase